MTAAAPAVPSRPAFRWRLRAPDAEAPGPAGPWPALVSELLAARGVRSADEAERWLGDGEVPFTDPSLMPGLPAAAERLASACSAGETVALIGDYDADGLTATAILTETLLGLGASVLPWLPDRFADGYGPNAGAVRDLRERGADMLLTADCGTSAVAEIALARSLGMDVIVADHHDPPDVLPDAILVNPKLPGSRYGSEPAACGVAWKLAGALHAALGRAYAQDAEHRALAALGSVCDMVPLTGENREIVRAGLGDLARTRRPGLLALAASARAPLARATADLCGWVLGPRLNAAGRMTHARAALRLLLTRRPERARELAAGLERLNAQRRAVTAAAAASARAAMTPEQADAPLIVAAGPDIHAGVAGLVAARLAEERHRPAIAIGVAGGELRASCRSIPGFDVTAMLARNADLFLRYGGHAAAAGFSADAARLDELRERLVADAAARLTADSLAPSLGIDAELPLEDADGGLLRWLDRLGPHGPGNPEPVFLARGAMLAEARAVGADGTHLRFGLRASRAAWRGIGFGLAHLAPMPGARADLVYRFRRDNLTGDLQVEALDLRQAA